MCSARQIRSVTKSELKHVSAAEQPGATVDPYDYYQWRKVSIEINGLHTMLDLKASLPNLADLLPADKLLHKAIHTIEGLGDTSPSVKQKRAINLTSGAGLVSNVLVKNGLVTDSFDDNVIALDATKRTAAWNGIADYTIDCEADAPGKYDIAVMRAPLTVEIP